MSKAFDKVWRARLIPKLRQNGICDDVINNILKDFSSNRKQRFILNDQCSSLADIYSGVPQGSILGPLFFVVYISDLSVRFKRKGKLFPGDIAIFLLFHDVNISANDLTIDSRKIYECTYQRKIKFNSDASKQAQEIIFSRKVSKPFHSDGYFNNNPVNSTLVDKHLGMILYSKLNFKEHLKPVLAKVNKTIDLIRKF